MGPATRAFDSLCKASRALGAAAMLTAGALASGCDAGDAAHDIDKPKLSVLGIDVATSVVDGALVYAPLGDGSAKVVATSSIKVRFDRFLLPSTVTRQSLCVQSLLKPVTKPDECIQGVFLEPAYDPIRREAVYRQAPGAALIAGTPYKVSIFAAPTVDAAGFRAFDGAPILTPVSYELIVADDDGTTPPEDGLPKRELFCLSDVCVKNCKASVPKPSVKKCQDACPAMDQKCQTECAAACSAGCPLPGESVLEALGQCAFGGCHGYSNPQSHSEYPTPAEGLDLTGLEGVVATAIGRAAHGSQTGEHAQRPEESPSRFGRAMPLIDPGSAGNSYMLYKLILSDLNHVPRGGLLEGELERLRASVVVGMPMPAVPPDPPSPAILEEAEAQRLVLWIQQGALPNDCGPTSTRP